MKTIRLIAIILALFVLTGCVGRFAPEESLHSDDLMNTSCSYNPLVTVGPILIRRNIVGTPIAHIALDKMDDIDRQQLHSVLEEGASGQAYGWTNPRTRYKYQIIPQPIQISCQQIDHQRLHLVLEEGVSGPVYTWTNPRTNYKERIVPYSAQPSCRQFNITGKNYIWSKQTIANACRNEAGQWEIFN